MKIQTSIVAFLLAVVTLVGSIDVRGESVIRAQIFKMPEIVELSSVTTAGHYILSSHLVRPILKLDKFGKIQADIATKWESSKDHKTWTFTIGQQKFSNGDLITVEDIVRSLERQIKIGTGVHFPFSEIESVKATGTNTFQIVLKNARNDLIYDLSKPEFGVLYKSDYSAEKGALKLNVTSGPYSLSEKQGLTYKLKKNKFFTADVKNELDLTLEGSAGEQSAQALLGKNIDFFTTQQNLTSEKHEQVVGTKGLKAFKPHVGFSYWLSINPDSSYFKQKLNRSQFQSFVRKFQSPELKSVFWEKANQLYLPDGDGRPSNSDLEKTWSEIEKHKFSSAPARVKLTVVPLKMTNTLISDVLEYLKSRYDVEVLSYTTEEELQAILKKGTFDIKISSNDFSSIDLSENLKTTFNASRPYIFLNQGSPVKGLLDQAAETDDKSKQSEIFKKIGLTLLNEGLIAPLAYQRIWFYHNDKLDISAWSTIYPEISIWKVKVNE